MGSTWLRLASSWMQSAMNGQIGFADRLATGQGAAAEHHVRATFAAAFHLTSQAFEEGGGRTMEWVISSSACNTASKASLAF